VTRPALRLITAAIAMSWALASIPYLAHLLYCY
jgi:hypothetical protein